MDTHIQVVVSIWLAQFRAQYFSAFLHVFIIYKWKFVSACICGSSNILRVNIRKKSPPKHLLPPNRGLNGHETLNCELTLSCQYIETATFSQPASRTTSNFIYFFLIGFCNLATFSLSLFLSLALSLSVIRYTSYIYSVQQYTWHEKKKTYCGTS